MQRGSNTVGYAYQMGKNRRTKLSVIKVDPESHRMKIEGGPVVLSDGFSPYVNMIDYPYSPADPHTFVYYAKAKKSLLNICRFKEKTKRLSHCEDFTWMEQDLSSVQGVALGGGRLLFVFATKSGRPFYQLLGVSKK